jgi:hypothetical protein
VAKAGVAFDVFIGTAEAEPFQNPLLHHCVIVLVANPRPGLWLMRSLYSEI